MERVETGIGGLDEMLNGGIPKGHIVSVLGAFGTGKTCLATQFINHGLKRGEKALFITLEEEEESIIENALSFGFELRAYTENGSLAIYKLQPSDARNSIEKIKNELPKAIENSGVQRLVIDSISLLTMMFDNEGEKRETLFSLCQKIKNAGATAIFTAEAKPDNPNVSRDGIVEYVSDGVIVLYYLEDPQQGGEIKTFLKVLKMRRTAHSRKIKPYELGKNGITVLSKAEVI
ncbi:MAG: KaiC domain-containing protein [Thermoplasmata archaeon]|nr:KaiC domain-containing protein [Thermoplasmata archaeon]